MNIYLVMLIVLHVAGTSHCSGLAAKLSYVTDMLIVLHRAIRSHSVRLCCSTYSIPLFWSMDLFHIVSDSDLQPSELCPYNSLYVSLASVYVQHLVDVVLEYIWKLPTP